MDEGIHRERSVGRGVVSNPRAQSYACNLPFIPVLYVPWWLLSSLAWLLGLVLDVVGVFVDYTCRPGGRGGSDDLLPTVSVLDGAWLRRKARLSSGVLREHVWVDGVVMECGVWRRGGGEKAGGGKKRLFVLLPGNPGGCDFYDEFLEAVGEGAEGEVELGMCLSLAGHTVGTGMESLLARETAGGLRVDGSGGFDVKGEALVGAYPGAHGPLSLEAQVGWCCKFVRRLAAEAESVWGGDVEIVLSGHSIGAWIAMRVAGAVVGRVRRVVCPFPTIEHLGASPHGISLYPVMCLFQSPMDSVMRFLWLCFPHGFRRAVGRLAVGNDAPGCAVEGVVRIIAPGVAPAALHMGKQEMEQVMELGEEVLRVGRMLRDKLILYYGFDDTWNVSREEHDVARTFPHAIVRIDDKRWRHAFELDKAAGIELGHAIGATLAGKPLRAGVDVRSTW